MTDLQPGTPAVPDDPREPYGRIVNETRRAFELEREAARGEKGPAFYVLPWEQRHPSQQELDMRIGSAVRDAVLSAAPAGGELVRQTWVYWALEQPDVAEHPNWVKSWAELDERDREVDDRIYSAVAAKAVHDAGLRNERLEAQLFALAANLQAVRRALTIAISEAVYEAEAKPYRTALQALGISEEDGAP